MARRVATTDAAVLGGGPAGSVVALCLARLGYRVGLVTRPRLAARHEGLSARAVQGLRTLGLARTLECVGPAVPRRVTWNGETRVVGTEHLVDRAALDAALLEDAAAEEVTVIRDRVAAVERDGSRWRLAGQGDGGEPLTLEAGFLVEARGREAPVSGPRQCGLPTTALVRRWALPSGRPAGTAVAGFPRGWAWFAATAEGPATLQVVIASGRGELPAREGLERFYDACVADLSEAAEWLNRARPAGPVLARHAIPVLATSAVGGRVLRVGDAALAIDPLAGQGVFEALGGALAAVAVVHTLLERPGDGDAAREFYEARLADAFWRHARIGRDHYAGEARWPDAPFWAARRAWPDGEPVRPRGNAGQARILERAVMADGFVVRRPVVVTPDHPRGVWQVDGVPLVSLLEFLRDRSPAPAAPTIGAAAASLGRPATQVTTAFDWLRAQGLVY